MQTTTHPVSAEELMAYLDGELPPARAVDVHQHLEMCRECQSLAADFQSVSRGLGEWQVEEISPNVKIPQKTSGKKRLSSWFWAPIAAAALLAVIAVIYHPGLTRQTLADRVAPAPPQLAAESRFSGGVIGGVPMDSPMKAPSPPPQSSAPSQNGPMIIRTAELKLITRGFDQDREAVQQIVKQHSGYIAEMSINATAGEARSLHASLRVAATQFDSFLPALRRLGQVTYESQHGEDVTKQFVDLNARLNNARNTEQRLTELLRDRTGKLSDVLAVEEQIDNVRGQIESMEADVKNMSNQVAFSSVDLTITEEYKTPLSETGNPPITMRLHNAAVEGYRNVVAAAVAFLTFLLSVGPVLLVIAALLFFPARLIWRKIRA